MSTLLPLLIGYRRAVGLFWGAVGIWLTGAGIVAASWNGDPRMAIAGLCLVCGGKLIFAGNAIGLGVLVSLSTAAAVNAFAAYLGEAVALPGWIAPMTIAVAATAPVWWASDPPRSQPYGLPDDRFGRLAALTVLVLFSGALVIGSADGPPAAVARVATAARAAPVPATLVSKTGAADNVATR